MKKGLPCFLVVGVTVLSLIGCARLALRAASPHVPSLTSVFFEECDLKLASQSLPAQLKLMEGLLNIDPNNREFLTALCMGYTGYAMLFVEDEDPERASRLYRRARGYGLRAIGIEDAVHPALQQRLREMDAGSMEPLFWMAVSWNGWIQLNLDKPAALGELGEAQACLDRVMEIDPEYFFGTPYLMAGAMLAARPGILGGDAVRAKGFFSKGMAASNGAFFLAPYYYARYYAVRVQDKALFLDLIRRVEEGHPDQLKEVCLINASVQQKIKGLKGQVDELFF